MCALSSTEEEFGRAMLRANPAFASGFLVVLILSAANAGFLSIFGSRADTDYAWSIRLPVSDPFLGGGGLAIDTARLSGCHLSGIVPVNRYAD